MGDLCGCGKKVIQTHGGRRICHCRIPGDRCGAPELACVSCGDTGWVPVPPSSDCPDHGENWERPPDGLVPALVDSSMQVIRSCAARYGAREDATPSELLAGCDCDGRAQCVHYVALAAKANTDGKEM